MSVNVYIEGDKSGFNSKVAVDKFKAMVKKDTNIDVISLKSKYIKSDYKLEIVNKTDTEIKFKLSQEKNETPEVNNRELLKTKLNMMRKNRTNTEIHKAKANKNVPEDILNEYMKLKKLANNMPIPEPSEILANPEQYRPVISMVLGNSMMKQYGTNHPYVRYFKLLAEKLGVDEALPVPTQDYSEVLKNKVISQEDQNVVPELVNVKGNMISADYETDSETNDSEN